VGAGAAAADFDSVGDAVSAHVAARNGGVSISGAGVVFKAPDGVLAASETLRGSFAL